MTARPGKIQATGSAPRVRGTRQASGLGMSPMRFSPACAGNTSGPHRRPSSPSVQPRVCGEHSIHARCDRRHLGSAPRVRGTRGPLRPHRTCDRFSPACAGNTSSRVSAVATAPVQPRVCGEHLGRHGAPDAWFGSAPRVRGTPASLADVGEFLRFSPACAGNTNGSSVPAAPWSVQPRVCGEHVVLDNDPQARSGSAPRVRGTRVELPTQNAPRRFSPACAGNTATASR